MYGIAITVAACLRAGTRADVGWLVSTEGIQVEEWSGAVVFTPGGGHTGSLLGGALDARLAEKAGRWSRGRLLDMEISQVDALIAELPEGGRAKCLLVPAGQLPAKVWDLAGSRARFCLVTELSGDEVVAVDAHSAEDVAGAGSEVEEAFDRRRAGSMFSGNRVISVFEAVPQMIVVGSGPIAEAVVAVVDILGWQPVMVNDLPTVSGHIAPLSSIDNVLVAAHDLELAGNALSAALESDAGYIGSLGSRKMQEDRADWLAYRGVEDLSRIHGPAGLDIGADTPGEVAVAIVAEAIASGAGRN